MYAPCYGVGQAVNHPPKFLTRAIVFLALLATAALAAALTQRSNDPAIAGRWSLAYAAFLCGLAAIAACGWLACLGSVQRGLWSARKPLALLGASLGLSLMACEIAFRILDPLGLGYHDEIGRYIQLRQDDDVLAYVQPRDIETELDGVQVRFNNKGLRGPDIVPQKGARRRLLVLGDSVAFGWGVAEESIFVTRLAESLSQATGTTWESINAGVCSYNTEQEFLYLENAGLALQPDLVVLVYVDNDIVTYAEKWKDAEAAKPPLRRRIKRTLLKSHLLQAATHLARRGGNGIELEGVERAVDASDPGWVRNMRALEQLVKLCAQHDLPLAAYHFRWRSDAWSDALLAAAREAAAPIEITDTAPWFDHIDLRQLVNSVTDSHPNARAHALTAQRMQHDLEERKLFEVVTKR